VTSAVWNGRVLVMKSETVRRPAVGCIVWLDERRDSKLRVMGRFPSLLPAQRVASRQALQRRSAQAAPVILTNAARTNRRGVVRHELAELAKLSVEWLAINGNAMANDISDWVIARFAVHAGFRLTRRS
jgi:hypothetical protein